MRSEVTGGPTRQGFSRQRGRKLSNDIQSWPMPKDPSSDPEIGPGWPTPVRGDAKNSARHTTTTGVMHSGTMMLDAVRVFEMQRSGTSSTPTGAPDPTSEIPPGESGSSATPVVNPAFLERLMGWPAGWTDIDASPESLQSEIQLLFKRRTGDSEDSSPEEDNSASGDDPPDNTATVTLRRNSDGLERSFHVVRHEGLIYSWAGGDRSCDCNRHLFFERAGGADPFIGECKCTPTTPGRYPLVKIVVRNDAGREFTVNGDEE